MSLAPGGGGYAPRRCRTSGRFTPAAATRINTSPAPGTGSGRSTGLRTSGGPASRSRRRFIDQRTSIKSSDSHRAVSRRATRRQAARTTLPAPRERSRRRAASVASTYAATMSLPEVVVDHVAAVLVDEARRAAPRAAANTVPYLSSHVGGRCRVDLAVEVPPRRFVAGVRQPIDQRRARRSSRAARAGSRPAAGKQHAALELQPLGARKRDVDAVVRRAFGDQRLRREQRIHRELDPAAVANQVLLEQHVVDVVTRDSLRDRPDRSRGPRRSAGRC